MRTSQEAKQETDNNRLMIEAMHLSEIAIEIDRAVKSGRYSCHVYIPTMFYESVLTSVDACVKNGYLCTVDRMTLEEFESKPKSWIDRHKLSLMQNFDIEISWNV